MSETLPKPTGLRAPDDYAGYIARAEDAIKQAKASVDAKERLKHCSWARAMLYYAETAALRADQ